LGDLPGNSRCERTGRNREECLANLKDAIQLLLETERAEAFRLDPQAETQELVLA
jgi:predicted RNase H-like HicB family nuclease